MGRDIEIAYSTQNLMQNSKNVIIIWENWGYKDRGQNIEAVFSHFSNVRSKTVAVLT